MPCQKPGFLKKPGFLNLLRRVRTLEIFYKQKNRVDFYEKNQF